MAGSNKRWAAGGGLVAALRPAGDAQQLGDLWRRVEAEADGSVFQSWLWLGCRFDERFRRALVLTIEAEERIVAIGLLGCGGRRFGLSQYCLAETGVADEDSVFIEHNGPLVVRDRPEARAAWFAAALRPRAGLGWILRLSGLGPDDAAAARLAGVTDGGMLRAAPWRDLARLRAAGADCLDVISANTRQQINRAWRRYAASGPISVARAATVVEAEAWLAALADLHRQTWEARGKAGAFAGAGFGRFHAALVARGVACGAVDVLRVAAGDRVIGYLYNFVWRGRVSAYQSGFAYDPAQPHEKPGLVCHVAAMRHYQARGLDGYDFLAGDDRYKTSLADGSVAMRWMRAAPRRSVAAAILATRARIARWRG